MKHILKVLVLLTCSSLWAASGDSIDLKDKKLTKAFAKFSINFLEDYQAMSLEHAKHGQFFILKTETHPKSVKYIYIGRVNTCRTGTCSSNSEMAEYFDYIIFFDKHKAVSQVKVYNYQASHGQEITAKSWLKQFIGYQGKEELKVYKNIDGISGATISSYAITEDINTCTKRLQQVQ